MALRLAGWVDGLPDNSIVGFDGDPVVGTTGLADAVAAQCVRPVMRVSTRWWWRAASLRLEHGRQDVDSLLHAWVDVDALRRELVGPLRAGGSGRHLTRLRDPGRDRSVRQRYAQAASGSVLLLDGPFLETLGLPFDRMVVLRVSLRRLGRELPPDRLWELAAFERYHRQRSRADVTVSYDHPDAPAVAGLAET